MLCAWWLSLSVFSCVQGSNGAVCTLYCSLEECASLDGDYDEDFVVDAAFEGDDTDVVKETPPPSLGKDDDSSSPRSVRKAVIARSPVARTLFVVRKGKTSGSRNLPGPRRILKKSWLELLQSQLCFVSERKVDYHRMVEEFAGGQLVTFVARNMGVWMNRSNTLSVLDCTILTPVRNQVLSQELHVVFEKQVSSLGYGKEVYGAFEVVNINTVLVQLSCSLCKSAKVRRLSRTDGHCFLCNVPVPVLEVPRLQDKIVMPDRAFIDVTLTGDTVNKVLALGAPFKDLYSHSVLDARERLASVKKTGTFMLSHTGRIISFTPTTAAVD